MRRFSIPGGPSTNGSSVSRPSAFEVSSRTVLARLSKLTYRGDAVVALHPDYHRVTLNLGSEQRFESEIDGQRRIVPLRRHSLLFEPSHAAPVLCCARGRRASTRTEGNGRAGKIVPIEVARSVFDAAAQAAGWAAEDLHGLGPMRLTLDGVGRGLAQALVAALHESPPAPAALLEALVRGLAVWVLTQRPEPATGTEPDAGRSGLQRALDRIEAELDQALSVQLLAETAGMSLNHFARRFKQAQGVSPYRYILRARLERAVRRMSDTLASGRELRVGDVALEAGFASHSQFSSMFRRSLGMTPAQWLLQRAPPSVPLGIERP
jgi:AraC-like DNA-binding protein